MGTISPQTAGEVIRKLKQRVALADRADPEQQHRSIQETRRLHLAAIDLAKSALNWQRKAEKLWPILGVRDGETLIQAAERVAKSARRMEKLAAGDRDHRLISMAELAEYKSRANYSTAMLRRVYSKIVAKVGERLGLGGIPLGTPEDKVDELLQILDEKDATIARLEKEKQTPTANDAPSYYSKRLFRLEERVAALEKNGT